MSTVAWKKLPEEQAEDRERADVSSTAAGRGEDASKKPSGHQDDALPDPEVRDGVKGRPLVLPVAELTLWPGHSSSFILNLFFLPAFLQLVLQQFISPQTGFSIGARQPCGLHYQSLN